MMVSRMSMDKNHIPSTLCCHHVHTRFDNEVARDASDARKNKTIFSAVADVGTDRSIAPTAARLRSPEETSDF